jgi:hypothetical protein
MPDTGEPSGQSLWLDLISAKVEAVGATKSATLLQILRWGRYIFRYSRPISGFLRGVDLLVSY